MRAGLEKPATAPRGRPGGVSIRELEPAGRAGEASLGLGRWHEDCGRVLAEALRNIFMAW